MHFCGKGEALGTLRKLTGCGVRAALKEMQDRYQIRLELIGNRRPLDGDDRELPPDESSLRRVRHLNGDIPGTTRKPYPVREITTTGSVNGVMRTWVLTREVVGRCSCHPEGRES